MGGKGCDAVLCLVWLDAMLEDPQLQAAMSDVAVRRASPFDALDVRRCVHLLAHFVATISA